MTDLPKRKAIPDRIKKMVLVRQGYRCPECRETLIGGPVDFDHRPALITRLVNLDGTDYHPPQLDPEHIDALHPRPCHLRRTVGRMPGAEKTVTTKGSDAWLAAKFRRLARPKTAKAKIPSRPFPKRRK